MYTVENLETLWNRVSAGDDKAFAAIHVKLYPDLLRYALNLTRDEELADDLLQDLFVKFWQKKEQIGPIANVTSYFFRSTRSIILDHFKSAKIKENKLRDLEPFSFECCREEVMILEENNHALKDKMLCHISKLPERQKEVIYLRFYQNMEYNQITEITGIRYQSVINNVYRAIQALRESCTAMKYIYSLLLPILFTLQLSAQQVDFIRPAEVWPDIEGNHIQAHGGGIIKVKKTYYWYGEQRGKGLDSNFRYVSCYASKDLLNWTFKSNALVLGGLDTLLGNKWVLERPKVFYNAKTKKYVMYMHIDGRYKAAKASGNVVSNYTYASVGTAISDRPEGPFKFLRSFRPLGRESRDIGQFVDDDGSAYLIFEDRPLKGFHIARLSADYLDVEEDVSIIQSPLEGGAIVRYDGLYYVIGSALTGWSPNPNKYATAKSLAGPWSEFKDIAPVETKTYGSQSTLMLKVVGKKKTSVIFMGDIWKPRTQWDSRYLWMPLEIGAGKLWLPEPKPWTIDLKTGEARFISH